MPPAPHTMFFDLSTLFTDEELPRQPQQQRSMAKQQAIFEATAELFAEKGYTHTNTKEIAARAGVSIGTLYFNFKDKRQILIGMLASQVSRYAELEPVDHTAVRTDPIGYFSDQLKLAFPYDRVFYNLADGVRELSVQDEVFRGKLWVLIGAVNQRVREITEAGDTADMLHPNLDIEAAIGTVSALIFNLYAVLPSPADVDEEYYWRRFDAAVFMISRAIFREEYLTRS